MIADVIVAVAGLVTAIGIVLASFWAYRAKERAARAAELAATAAQHAADASTEIMLVHGEIRALGKRVDGRLSELLASSIAAARSEGVAAGEQSQRDRAAPSDTP